MSQEDGSPRLKPPFLVREKCNIHERQVEDIWLYDITSKTADGATHKPSRKPKRIYYVAGGSWQAPPDDAHWKFLSDLVRRLDQPATVTLISTPLAPKSYAEIAFPLLSKLYHALSADDTFHEEDVCFAGDSSGGNIVLSLAMHGLGNGAEAPASLVLISPSVDLSHDHPGLEQAGKRDPLESLQMVTETAKAWAQNWDLKDPRLSPALGNVKILADHNVKIYGIIAGDDVLGPEAEDFVLDCQKLGVEGRFLLWGRQLHDFPIMSPYKFPESVKAIEWITLALNDGSKDTDETQEKFAALETRSLKAFSRHATPVKVLKDKKLHGQAE